MEYHNLCHGVIAKRPSRLCKTPYVADVVIDQSEYLVHSPSLGCSGLTDVGCRVLMVKLPEDPKRKSSHRIQFSRVNEMWLDKLYTTYVCTNPQVAEHIVEYCLKNNALQCIRAQSYKGQVTYENSRFDFAGVDEKGNEFILEVKAVPVADYHNVSKQEKKKMIKENTFVNREPERKIAIFPDGYIKPSKVPVPQSERANKHILELTHIKQTTQKRTMMMYVVQRSDVESFVLSELDPIYKENVRLAKAAGVELYYIVMNWYLEGDNTIKGNVIKEECVVI